ncbi:MAG TPA: TIGR00282 family metallophosphoesterase [Pirellula sp.]|nr:TIGR00282 family metallophosphoesterase [Pirellula sp.]
MTIPPKNSQHVRIILVGDVVGKPGVSMLCDSVPWLRTVLQVDLVIVNAENAADGAGLTISQYNKLDAAGVDAITLGDHIYRKKEITTVLETATNIVKPANFPVSAPGRDHCIVKTNQGVSIAVISLLGRVFMRPVDCPFAAVTRVLASLSEDVRIRICDLHAEATSDMQTMGRFLDGKVTAVLGTHTHVATADEEIFPGGTAFQCDVGMTGPHRSILGRAIEPVLNTTLTFDPNSFHVAKEDVRLSGTWVDADPLTGKAVAIGRVRLLEGNVKQWLQQGALHLPGLPIT